MPMNFPTMSWKVSIPADKHNKYYHSLQPPDSLPETAWQACVGPTFNEISTLIAKLLGGFVPLHIKDSYLGEFVKVEASRRLKGERFLGCIVLHRILLLNWWTPGRGMGLRVAPPLTDFRFPRAFVSSPVVTAVDSGDV
jgi:hypothetical protein